MRKSEIIYKFWILKPEQGFRILKQIWIEFEKIIDFYDRKGIKEDFRSNDFKLIQTKKNFVEKKGFREKIKKKIMSNIY